MNDLRTVGFGNFVLSGALRCTFVVKRKAHHGPWHRERVFWNCVLGPLLDPVNIFLWKIHVKILRGGWRWSSIRFSWICFRLFSLLFFSHQNSFIFHSDDRNMVYYTAVPLMMQSEHTANSQLCANEEPVRLTNLSNSQVQPPEHAPQQFTNAHSMQSTDNKPVNGQRSMAMPIQSQTPSTKPQHKCEQCNMFFGSKSAHTSHMRSHGKTSRGSTSASSTTSTTPSPTSSSDPYQCDVCKKTFAVPARLVRHYRTHTGERPFECEFCHKMFSVKENLQVHRRIHTKERPYKCDVCGRAFEHSGKLHRHMRIHTGERPHKCSVCAKTFIQSGQLVIHMRTHTGLFAFSAANRKHSDRILFSGEKPYKCSEEGCGKGFTCSKQLKVHSRTHTGEKPYRCDICFRDFGYNHVLKLHRVQHYGSKCYKCTLCDETFKSKKEMETHIKGHASEEPDEEHSGEATASGDKSNVKREKLASASEPISTTEAAMQSPSAPLSSSPPLVNITMIPTPRDTSSEATSDGDEISYYNLYSSNQRFEQPNPYHVQSPSAGVNPVLLAAVSIATSQSATEVFNQRNMSSQINPSSSMSVLPQAPDTGIMNSSYIYEPLAVMRQQGYFTPAPKVEEFRYVLSPSRNRRSPETHQHFPNRSSIDASSDIVKRVEAALASAEPMLTPPRSTPESPDRSSSPESDCILMADRDVMSLPLRKRKLYLRDNQNQQPEESSPPSPVVRMSSVIQFAKAS